MLQPGTVIELTLAGAEAPIQAKVLSCSSTMLSVRLQEVGTETVHRVSLKKLPYSVVRLPGEAAEQQPAAAGDAQQQASQQQQDGSEEEEEQQQQDGSGSDDDEQQPDHIGSGSEDEEAEPALDAFPSSTAAAVEAFAAAVEEDPGALLAPAPQLAELAKGAAKALYDYAAAAEGSGGGSGGAAAAGALPELYIDGFDAEQVWLQLELAAGPALKRARRLLKKAGHEPELLTAEMEEAIDELLEDGPAGSDSEQEGGSDDELEGGSGSEGSEGEEEDGDGLSDVDYDALLAAGAAQQRRRQAAATGASDSEDEEAAAAQLAGNKRKRLGGRAAAEREQVEDEHFKLDDMEAFVQQAEREAAGLEDGEDEEGDSDDEEAELEAALERETASLARDKKAAKKARKKARRGAFGEGEMDEEEAAELGATATYEDFFGPRSGGTQGPAMVAAGGRRRQPQDLDGMEEEEEEEEDDEEEGFEDDLLDDDMLSGDEEEGREGGLSARRRGRGAEQGPSSEEEGGSEDEEGGSSDEDLLGGRGGGGGGRQRDLLDESGSEDEEGEGLALSAHELRQQRMADRIRRLEAAALGEKAWFMQGEVDAARRPKNSALEVDLDFDTTVKPPPQPTEELTASLDDLIKRRIVEARWDDVVRAAPPPPDTKRLEVGLDDSKPQQGLGELYEAEYMQTVAGAADDKDEEVRQAARAQFAALCAKLDALSHLHFTPRPVLEEVVVKVDVPAIMMEDAAPAFVSGASMRAPEEVYVGEGRKGAAPAAEGELEREDRKRRRAQKKRGSKKRKAAKDEERAARAVTAGGTAPLVGRKSAAAEEAARKLDKTLKKKSGRKGGSSEFGKSTKLFGMIQQHTSGATVAAAAAAADAAAPRASHLKL